MSIGLLMLLAPGCGRSSLEPEDLDGSVSSSSSGTSGQPFVCGPSTCSNGCCDANGACQTGRNARACGAVGGTCSDCVATGFDTCTTARVCARTVTNCGPSNCSSGCCSIDDLGNEQCLSGTEATACGLGGGQCVDCESDGRACDLSTRSCGTTRCDISNCSGCCVGDLCLPGNSTFACGENGGQCGRCNSGELCRITSVGGGRCETTQTKCNSSNCKGCCTASGQCLDGSSDGACGQFGTQCDVCNFNETCTGRFCQPFTNFCGPGNCDGCCLGDICIPNGTQSDSLCGIKGQQCLSCGPTQTCNTAGFCEQVPDICGPDNCDGCCIGDVCARGTQNTACGLNGVQCSNCLNQGRTCSAAGTCQSTPQCNASTCPNGCCNGNTCVGGTSDTACGGSGGGLDGGPFPFPGQQCQNCTIFGQTCQNRVCQAKCGPSNCGGCCNAAGACVTGFTSNACGSQGNACDSCTSRSTFCNSLVSPRTCNDNQKECPSPTSGSCAAGETITPVKEKQNVCSDFELDDIAFSCFDADDFFCQITIDQVSQTNPSCGTCMEKFAHAYARRTGLFNCAASDSSVTSDCRHQMACTEQCDSQSCNTCNSDQTETSCYTLVNSGSGQCNKFSSQTTCANTALAAGELCSQFTYPDFTSWLREVGDHFCGDDQ